jgi:hypothetical protein
VHADYRAPPLASAATDGLDQRVTRNESQIHVSQIQRASRASLRRSEQQLTVIAQTAWSRVCPHRCSASATALYGWAAALGHGLVDMVAVRAIAAE